MIIPHMKILLVLLIAIVLTGIGYATVRSWPWLPMLGGLLFYDDFVAARRLHLGLLR
jgi:hypothetical protein